jgi:Leucine-rich repeat (LRR) protein
VYLCVYLCVYLYRVQCNSGGNVTSIDLKPGVVTSTDGGDETEFAFSISGSIPKKLGYLSYLRELDLSFNSFSATVPRALSGMAQLQVLDLSGNCLAGTLPSSLGDLTLLQRLSVYGNAFSGTVPASFARLILLTHLSLGQNALTGTLPAGLTALSLLQYLDVSKNGLLGDLDILNFASLLYVNASSCSFKTIPEAAPSVNRTGGLQTIIVSYNGFDSFPFDIGIVLRDSLTTFSASGNNLTDSRLPDMSAASTLTSLSFSDCGLQELPPYILNMRRLQYLDLSYNVFVIPALSDYFANYLPDLQFLDMSGIGQTGTIPSSFGNMSKLQYLYLADNSLTGTTPVSLCDITTLTDFDISGNPLFECFFHCITATTLTVDDNTVHCSGLADIAMCDLEETLQVLKTVQKHTYSDSSFSLQSMHPRTHGSPSAAMYSLTLDDSTYTQFQVSFGTETDLTNEQVVVCDTARCETVYGRYGGLAGLAPSFPGVGDVPKLNVISSTLYIEVDALSALTATEYGFSLDVSVTNVGLGWNCTRNKKGEVFAVGLCDTSTSWTGVTCAYGTQVGAVLCCNC